jgi:hypothetical protein
MTPKQLVALAFLDSHDAAAMRCRGPWVWATDIRNDPELASRFIKDWSDEQRDSELLRAWLAPSGKAVRQ